MTYAEILTYSAANVTGFVWSAAGGDTNNAFPGDLPDRPVAAEPHYALKGYTGSKASEPNFGAAALKHEWPRLQCLVRGPADDEQTAYTKAHEWYRVLGAVIAQTFSGTFYKGITCLQPPFFLRWDNGHRPIYAFNIEADKDVSA